MARIPPIENFRSGSPPARPLAQIGTRSGSRTQHQTQTQTQSLNMGQAMAGSVVYERLNEFEDLDEEDQLDEGDSSSDDKHLPKEPLPTAPRNERLNELEDFDEEDQLDEGDHSSDDDYQPDEPLRTSPRKKRKLVSGSPQAIRPLPDNRILDRKHRAAARILHSKGWDAADLSDASPIKNVSPKTFSRVIANDYADKDNVDSDDEHNTYVQFYEANRNRLKPRLTKSTSPSKKRDRPQRCRLAVIAVSTYQPLTGFECRRDCGIEWSSAQQSPAPFCSNFPARAICSPPHRGNLTSVVSNLSARSFPTKPQRAQHGECAADSSSWRYNRRQEFPSIAEMV
ncbi:hypothetical protein BJ138DRAFT_225683 [Hygrophoropsis aurantiaca]|uniref:Uncharacterized protein n=1 Tax=Hygrophoropsis aurantiaca TaxID=72124 RepID=A0ACB8ANG9_9AGAM|nr:hypothetical protein BJ138DRAFT_225683 [Hygrophoropsis aurantiaca]